MLTGPRGSGKTTSAERVAKTIINLDQENEASSFRNNPDIALADLSEPVLLDEWQEVPEVLGAIKRSVDKDTYAGRFIVTGSVRSRLMQPTWPGTGRLLQLPMYPLTAREQMNRTNETSIFDQITNGEIKDKKTRTKLHIGDYLELALSSGFPDALAIANIDHRMLWLESYIDELVHRDVLTLDARRDPILLRKFFEAYTNSSSANVTMKKLCETAGISHVTGTEYEALLTDLRVIEQIPAWHENKLKRISRNPKRIVTDAGFFTATQRLTPKLALRSGDLSGRIIETFTIAQLRAEIAVSKARPKLFHFREEKGRHEIDLIAELADGRIIAIEIKSSAAPTTDDATHLMWLQEKLPDRFVAGILFHTGPRSFTLRENIFALPIAAIWE